jgi:hypothetical protein
MTKSTTHSAVIWTVLTTTTILIALVSAFGVSAAAQGQNAVYNASSNCCLASAAFLDATQFIHSDLCQTINYMLLHVIGPSYPSGAVIDARGLNPNNVSMTCSISPWNGIASPPPATILLPATGGSPSKPIIISNTWVLPADTHLVGESDNIGLGDISAGTTIQASSTLSGPMIQFGNSTLCPSGCASISVENLILDGKGYSVNGIVNQYAGEGRFVDRVSLYRIPSTGLLVSSVGSSTYASNSGPYSKITCPLGRPKHVV